MNIAKALTVEGWMSGTELRWLAARAGTVPPDGIIIEIGSYLGRSACALAANTQATVYCVDVWNDSWDGWTVPPGPRAHNFEVFSANTAEFNNIVAIHQPSVPAAQGMAETGVKANLIFIDAAHDEYNVRQDIMAWLPLLVESGVFCGHDYGNSDWPDVKRVVDEIFPYPEVVDTIWIAPCMTTQPL